MEMSKNSVFKTQYTSVLDVDNNEHKNRTSKSSKMWSFIKNNKIISITALIFITCLSFNLFMIYNFIKIIAIR